MQEVSKQPIRLPGQRRLHAIDVPNLFCEIDEYARAAYPQFNLDRSKIKAAVQAGRTAFGTILPAELGHLERQLRLVLQGDTGHTPEIEKLFGN